jgi:uncharacterized protein (DUF697 family)
MKPEVSRTIHTTSATAGALAALLSPVPLLDEVVLLGVYGALVHRIGRAHGLELRAIPWKPVSITAASGLLARLAINLPFTFVPGVAAATNATTAVVLTEFFGRYVDQACGEPSAAKAYGPSAMFRALRSKRGAAAAVG